MSAGDRPRAEVIREVVFLGDLIGHIASGKVRVPRFQRGFVWKQQDLHALLDSVLRGLPIGSVLIWDTDVEIASVARVGPVEVGPPPKGLVGYLLDGQQRLSTLAGTLRLPEHAASTVDQVDWRIYCDLETLEFRRMPVGDGGPQLFPMSSLLDTSAFFAACRSIESQVGDNARKRRWLDQADGLANAFRNYKIPVIHIRNADLDTAVAVFARLNRTGRKMAADEMISALTYRDGSEFHLAEELDKIKSELDRRGFGGLDRVLLLRSVLAALDRDIYAKDWTDLLVKPDVRSELPYAFETAVNGLTAAVEFLRGLGVVSDRLLPYGLQLVLLGEFFRFCPKPAAEAVELLERWFWVTSFTGWFGGVSTSQATRALREIQDLAKETNDAFTVVDLGAAAQPFPERFDGRSARVRAFLLYLASLKPCSARTGENLDVGRLLANRGTGALAYLVPRREDMRPELRSSPANRAFADEQGMLGDLAALDDDKLRRVLPRHGFPAESIRALRSGDREGLIRARLESLVEGERAFLEARRVTLPATRTAAAIADSDASDDDGAMPR